MSHDKRDDEPAKPTNEQGHASEYDRFKSLTRRLLHVSKDDLREAEARERGWRSGRDRGLDATRRIQVGAS